VLTVLASAGVSRFDQPRVGIGREIRVGVAAFAALLLFGTIAFKLSGGEEWSWFDAFYMMILTVSTVGYHEVHALTVVGKVVAIVVIFMGVGIVLYLAGTTAEALIEGKLFWRRRVQRTVRRMSGHLIVCGHGRVGRAICQELRAQSVPFVVIDREEPPEAENEPQIVGDATDDETLRQAGIDRCRGLVAVLGSDAENIYTVLAARALRPDAMIVARCTEERSRRKLEAAGARRVINPYLRGGILMARSVLRPQVVDFVEEISNATGVDILLGEVEIAESSSLNGSALRASGIRNELDIIITAIVKRRGDKIFNPSPDETIETGDVLIAMGRAASLEQLDAMARGKLSTAGKGSVR